MLAEKPLNIKLISPMMSMRPIDSGLKQVLSPPMALVIIASLTPKPHKVWIEDENIGDINFNDAPDLVGISVNVDTSFRAAQIADYYRSRGVKVIFGGIHASSNPQQVLQHCDSVLIGEAEQVWNSVLSDLQQGILKSIYKAERVVDLTDVPIPKWNYINKQKYLYHNVIVTSRGCPFRCNFCYNSSEYVSSKFRNRPVENVIDEIKALKTKHIMFIDDNFIGNIRWTRQLISEMKKLNLTWNAAVSANIYHHEDLIDEFAASGCRSLFIGFESINENSIQSASKQQNKVTEYEALIALLHRKGIMVNASLVFGFDSDTPDVFRRTLEWLVRNKVETMTAHILTPYPGTVFHKQLEVEGRITDTNLSHYNTSNVVFSPKQMSAEELRSGYLWMYNQFYTFKNIYRRFPDLNGNRRSFLLFNIGYRKFGRITAIFGKLGLTKQIGWLARRLSYGID